MPKSLFGLPLSEITWSKFALANTFHNNHYHLRRTKLLLYQLAMILSAITNGFGQSILILYLQRQSHPQEYISSLLRFPPSYLHIYNISPRNVQLDITSLIAVMSLNIFYSLAVPIILGTAWFLDIVWPERVQSAQTRNIWRALSLSLSVVGCADVVAMSVVILTQGVIICDRRTLPGIEIRALEPVHRKSFLRLGSLLAFSSFSMSVGMTFGTLSDISLGIVYLEDWKCTIMLCALWLAWAAVLAGSGAMWASHRHDEVEGVWSRVGREAREEGGEKRERV